MTHRESGFLRTLRAEGQTHQYYSLAAVEEAGLGEISRLPCSIKILLENLLRHEDGETVVRADVEAAASWIPSLSMRREVSFYPSQILTHDAIGINMLQDLAALRDAVARFGKDPSTIFPVVRTDLVVDHSVIVEASGRPDALAVNQGLEMERNSERYAFLNWAESAFANLTIVPPGNGICHQLNLERFANVVTTKNDADSSLVFPDTCLGTDSHTPMINALGVLGWGVGAIEAETALLGQPVRLVLPDVVGIRLTGHLPPGTTATDLVLALTEILRTENVVGDFLEFFGPGVSTLSVPDRATVANMAPEFGSTTALFPIDRQTTEYLELTRQDPALAALVETYARVQGLWHDAAAPEPTFARVIEVPLEHIEPVLAGPSRPQQRVRLADVATSFNAFLADLTPSRRSKAFSDTPEDRERLAHGAVVLAAITSCTNTSNAAAMVTAGLLARNAVNRGLRSKSWVKTSLTPGSPAVAAYLDSSGLQEPLDQLGFQIAAFGCASCVGNSGSLLSHVTDAIEKQGLVAAAVLSGNRNFSGRVHLLTRANYLASPALVVAYALAGTVVIDLTSEPLGQDREGKAVFLRDLWPRDEEIAQVVGEHVQPAAFRKGYQKLSEDSQEWRALAAHRNDLFSWDPQSRMLRRPPFLDHVSVDVPEATDIVGGRPLVILSDGVTTDQISPAGVIPSNSPAGAYLRSAGIPAERLYTYPMRRGDPAVMARATFAYPGLLNRMAPGIEGGVTRYWPSGETMTIFDAATAYAAAGVPVIVVAGSHYGVGSSRDSAAKGPWMLGVRAVIAKSFERIHRANLIGMGILPLVFLPSFDADALGLDGSETFDILGLSVSCNPGDVVQCRITRRDGSMVEINLRVDVGTTVESAYLRHGGILPYMLRCSVPPERSVSAPGPISGD